MNNYELIKNIAQLFIQNLQRQQNISAEDIRERVETACQSAGVKELSLGEINKLVIELESQYQTVIGAERELLGDDEGWESWLPRRRGSIPWNYWKRYRTYLSQESFPEDVLVRLESSTDRVLGLMGDPNRKGSWDRRGLVVGLVQSGKTAHYVGVINKAVDSGYKVIVVLTGFTESLRIQTQVRLEQGVLGYSMRAHPHDSKRIISQPCGVDLVNPLRPRIDSVTTKKNDFKTGIAKNFAIQVGGNTIVFVIKKNVSVLKNLLQWVSNFGNDKDPEGNNYVKGIPLLVIDDESDVGSIDTKKGAVDELGDVNEEHDPTKINKQIRKLISLFDQSSYIGYTATPFANVLIHDQKKAGVDKDDGLLIGEDLFPRSFIVSLPTPSNYVGPTMIFGPSQDGEESWDGLPVIRKVSDTQLGEDRSKYWMPSSHRKNHVPFYFGQERIPDSLRKAVLSFILVIAARSLRGDDDKHNSMLVHVTRFTDVQHEVYEQIETARQDIVNRLRDKTANRKLLGELQVLWEGEETSFRETTITLNQRSGAIFQNPVHSWAEIHRELLEAVSSIEVRKINGTAGDLLDYDDNPSGLNVIAIGGDKLARGLTLEGLSVSYFLRCSKMYDTLMQMGRWFGYRPGYLDLCRLYTTGELSGWFSHIADATEELRNEFELMADSGCTPKEFGLKVRSHPTMMVTSAVKMRDGKPLQISFQGTMVQTIDFSRTEKSVNGNWAAAEAIVNRAEQDFDISPSSPRPNAAMWAGVPGQLVVDFLEGYRVHSAARTVKTPEIKKYIESQMKKGGLKSWTVLLSGAGAEGPMAELGGTAKVGRLSRGWFVQGTTKEELVRADRYRIKVLISPSDELVNLGPEEEIAALAMDVKDWKVTGGVRRGRKVDLPTKPNGRFVRQVKDPSKGLLILYPLLSDDEKAQNNNTPILGFVISFPAVTSLGDTPITYIVGNIYQQQDMEFHD